MTNDVVYLVENFIKSNSSSHGSRAVTHLSINALFNVLEDQMLHFQNNIERLCAAYAVAAKDEKIDVIHTLLMYLHPQTALHPQASVSYFHSQFFVGFSGGVFKVGGSASVMSVKFSCVIPGIVFNGDGESMCGDKERIRGKSISIILTFASKYYDTF